MIGLLYNEWSSYALTDTEHILELTVSPTK